MNLKWLILLVLFLVVPLIFLTFILSTSKTQSFLSPVSSAFHTELAPLASRVLSISSHLWLPYETSINSTAVSLPQISARSAFVIDLSTDKALYVKNIHQRQSPASTVKIMTAILALEQRQSDEIVTISKHAATIGEDFMGISENEKYTIKELLYGLLLPSGNDAAEALAESTAGSPKMFVDQMNAKAKLLGLSDTKFANPSGLDGDGEHFSTAYDLAVIARYAWTNFPLFRQIVGTKFYEIPYSQDHKYLYLENQTNLLSTYPGVKGIKPGYTPDAGLCLVTLAENGGHQVLAVILGSNDRRGEMVKLLDYSFATLGVEI